jgi:branched-chain amino acid aminotransferase
MSISLFIFWLISLFSAFLKLWKSIKKKIFISLSFVFWMQSTEFIWLNGKLVKWDDAKVHVLSHALHYGSGAFEGIRCYKTEKGAAIFRLKEHVERLLNSFSIFGVACPYSHEEIEKAIKETVRVNNLEEGYIRPILFFGFGEMGLKNLGKCSIDFAVACWPWGSYLGEKAINAKISSFRRLGKESFRTDAKICGHYVNSILSSKDVRQEGFDEAIMLDYQDNVAEGPGENIFIVKGGKIFTPKLGSILPGITRSSIITIANDLGYEVKEKDILQKELLSADECFFTGTAAEVTAIASINGNKIGNGRGRITEQLKKEYLDAVHGRSKRYEKWLAYVK